MYTLSVDYWINYEPCGLFCGSMSYCFILYGMYTTTVTEAVCYFDFSRTVTVSLRFFSVIVLCNHSDVGEKFACSDSHHMLQLVEYTCCLQPLERYFTLHV